VVVNARVELALVVELRNDLPASELPSFVEAVDGVEGTECGLEVDVDYAVLVALVQLDMLNGTKLVLLADVHS
jgi:hypothetical protein